MIAGAVGFVVRLLVVYVVLILPQARLDAQYARAYRAGANLLFAEFGEDGRVRFEENPAERGKDTRVVMTNVATGVAGAQPLTTRNKGWIPTALAIALAVAAPVPWPRRLLALVGGVALVQVFVAARTWLLLRFHFGDPAGLALASLDGATPRAMIEVLMATFYRSALPSFVVPVLAWAPLALRRADWDRLLGRA